MNPPFKPVKLQRYSEVEIIKILQPIAHPKRRDIRNTPKIRKVRVLAKTILPFTHSTEADIRVGISEVNSFSYVMPYPE